MSRIKCINCSDMLKLDEVTDHKYFCDGSDSVDPEVVQPPPENESQIVTSRSDLVETASTSEHLDVATSVVNSPQQSDRPQTPEPEQPDHAEPEHLRRSLRLNRDLPRTTVYQRIASAPGKYTV